MNIPLLENINYISPLALLLICLYSVISKRTTAVWKIAILISSFSFGFFLIRTITEITFHLLRNKDADLLGMVMLTLVTSLGYIIINYSSRYLSGEPNQNRYICGLTFTLAMVQIVALTSNLGILFFAWIATSLGLHTLLTFYSERRLAQITARKKFILSRVAEIALFAALALIYLEIETFDLKTIELSIHSMPTLPYMLHTAAVLVVIAILLKSAQLPFHGWLIQVMEAPTPVSALLHAGIINLGGFVLIRLSALISTAPIAQFLLVIIGSITAVTAGLVMLTRISIKVRLAWSTCAQIGFMLVECGLGLFDLAFLHLIAHSLYKAHAFLTAGRAVEYSRISQFLVKENPNQGDKRFRFAICILSLPISFLIVIVSGNLWNVLVVQFSVPTIAKFLIAIGIAPLIWPIADYNVKSFLRGLSRLLAISQLYFFLHLVFIRLLNAPILEPHNFLSIWTGCIFFLLFLLQTTITLLPAHKLPIKLYPLAYKGFYLEEALKKTNLRILFKTYLKKSPNIKTKPSQLLKSGKYI